VWELIEVISNTYSLTRNKSYVTYTRQRRVAVMLTVRLGAVFNWPPCCFPSPPVFSLSASVVVTNKLTPLSRILKKQIGPLSQNSPVLWSSNVHYHLHNSPPLSPSTAGGIQSMSSHPMFSIKINILIPSKPRSYTWLFPSPFPIKILCAYISSTCHMARLPRPPWFDHSRNCWWAIQTWSSSLSHFLRRLFTSPLLDFSN
jgi:hypothetical protein